MPKFILGVTSTLLLLTASAWVVLSSLELFYDPGYCENTVHSESLGPVRVGSVISRGAFSIVMGGVAVATGQEVAIKVGVDPTAATMLDVGLLKAVNGSDSFPYYYGSGSTRCEKKFSKRIVSYPYIVMERLGESVSSLKQRFGDRSHRLKAALKVAEQLLDGVHELHNLNYLLHDIYPENVLLERFPDTDESLKIKLIDFGEILPIGRSAFYRPLNSLYTSVREDRGEPLSPRDDLERIVYLIMAIADTRMPWEDVHEDNRKIAKVNFCMDGLGGLYPPALAKLFTYARRGLAFGAPIDVEYCRALLQEAAQTIV